MARSPFEILGVTPADDITTIRLAWRARVKALHPDRAADKRRATADLAEVNDAFDKLQGHRPDARAKAEKARQGEMRKKREQHAAKRPARSGSQASDRTDRTRRLQEAQEIDVAKARAAKARLLRDMGAINARAARCYADARRAVSTGKK